MNKIKVINKQNGGAEHFYDYTWNFDGDHKIKGTKDVTKIVQRRRSYLLGTINKNIYNILIDNIDSLRHGNMDTRSGGLKVRVYKPGEKIEFDNELLVIEDVYYDKRIYGYSTLYSNNVFNEINTNTNTYRILGVDMIWCRKDTLLNRLSKLL